MVSQMTPVEDAPEMTEFDEHRSEIAQARKSRTSIWNGPIIQQAIVDSFKKLNPRHLLGNPVMLVDEIGAAVTTYMFADEVLGSPANSGTPLSVHPNHQESSSGPV